MKKYSILISLLVLLFSCANNTKTLAPDEPEPTMVVTFTVATNTNVVMGTLNSFWLDVVTNSSWMAFATNTIHRVFEYTPNTIGSTSTWHYADGSYDWTIVIQRVITNGANRYPAYDLMSNANSVVDKIWMWTNNIWLETNMFANRDVTPTNWMVIVTMQTRWIPLKLQETWYETGMAMQYDLTITTNHFTLTNFTTNFTYVTNYTTNYL
jgi:hypothetical protein